MFTTRFATSLLAILFLAAVSRTSAGPADIAAPTADSWHNWPSAQRAPTDTELLSKRTLTAKHFRNPDGTCTAVISSAPVHYLNQNVWWDIDTRIRECSDQYCYKFCNDTNNFGSYFPADSGNGVGLQFTYEGADLIHWLDVRLSWTDASGCEHPVCDVSAVNARVEGDRIVYEDSFSNVDVEFMITNVGIKRTILFKAAPDCLKGAEEGSWLNVVERLVLPVGYYLSLGAERQTGGFAADGYVEIRDGQGSGFVTMDPLKISRVGTDAPSVARSGRRWFQFVGDNLYCYNQIPVEWLTGNVGSTENGSKEARGSSGVRATTLLRPDVTMWWTGWMDPDWFGDPPNYGCGDADIIVGTPDLQPPFYEYRGWAKFDVSSIDGDVTDSRLNLYLFQVAFGDVPYISVDYYSIDNVDPQWAHTSTANVLLLYADCQNGTQYYNNRPWYNYSTWTGDVDLGPAADAHIENPPVGDGTWWAVGFSSNTPAGCPDYCGDAVKARGYNGGTEAPKLTVTYTPACTPPTITSGATGGGTVTEGDPGPVTFTVTATGNPAPTYRWKRNAIDVSDDPGHIQGATTDTLIITNVELGDDGDYTCVATNMCGEDTSDPATLIVLPLGACCHDGGCIIEYSGDCTGMGGTYLGNNVPCGTPDCNGNGVNDACDILFGHSADLNGNGVPDECEASCCDPNSHRNGDYDGDCDVDLVDFSAMQICLGRNVGGPGCRSDGCSAMDLNRDRIVNLTDYALFQSVLYGPGSPLPDCNPDAGACDAWATGPADDPGLEFGGTFYVFGCPPPPLPPGYDCDSNGNPPIPAGFFGLGSQPFHGVVPLGGQTQDLTTMGTTDTLVEHPPLRFGFGDLPVCDTVSARLSSLSLRGRDPIKVVSGGNPNDCNSNGIPDATDIAGGTSTDANTNGIPDECEWYVAAELSSVPPQDGFLEACKTHDNGGTFDATIYVQPLFVFVNKAELDSGAPATPDNVKVLDTGVDGLPPIIFNFTDVPFSVCAPAGLGIYVTPCSEGNFVPGVDTSPKKGGGWRQETTCVSHIEPGEEHYFCPPECIEAVCTYSAVDGALRFCFPFLCGSPTCPPFPPTITPGPMCTALNPASCPQRGYFMLGFGLCPPPPTCFRQGMCIQFYGPPITCTPTGRLLCP